MGKQLVILLILISCTWTVVSAQEPERIRVQEAVNIVVADLNEYLRHPIDLGARGVSWNWEQISAQTVAQDCRGLDSTPPQLDAHFYEITIQRLEENYRYGISLDGLLVIPCVIAPSVMEGASPHLVDALADFNRRNHLNLMQNDVSWRWYERQFLDHTLGCGDMHLPDSEKYDRSVNGYVIEFTLRGEIWEYRVSSDRFIVELCEVREV